MSIANIVGASTGIATVLGAMKSYPLAMYACGWNPSDECSSPSYTLSNGNLTAVVGSNNSGWPWIRATLPITYASKRKVVWELSIDSMGSLTPGTGLNVAWMAFNNGVASVTAIDGSAADIQSGTGGGCNTQGAQPGGAANGVTAFWTGADKIMMAIDFAAKKFWVRLARTGLWNAAAIGSQNPATNTGGISFSGVAGTQLFPMYGATSTQVQTTANFGASPFVNTVPAGFVPWAAATGSSAGVAGVSGTMRRAGFVKSIQAVSITIPSAGASNTAAITAVDLTKAIILYQGATTTDTSGAVSACYGRIELTSAGIVTATRAAATSGVTTTVKATVIEFNDRVLSVQKGTIALANTTSNTASISAVSANAFVAYLGSSSNSGNGNGGVSFGSVTLTSSTVVTANDIASGSATTTTVGFIVVDFDASVVQSVQQLAHTDSSSATSYSDTITSVVPGNSLVILGGWVCNNTGTAALHTISLADATTVTYARVASTTTSRTVYCTVLEFEPWVARQAVQRGGLAIASATSATASISALNALAKSFANMAGFKEPSTSTFSQLWAALTLTNTTTLTGNINTAPVGTTTIQYEAFEFADIRNASALLNAISTVVGTMRALMQGAGTAAGVATASGTMQAAGGGVSQIVGTSAGVATAVATGRLLGRVSGTSAGVATASAAGRDLGRISGTAAGTSTASATSRALGRISATAAGIATATGTALALLRGSGAAAGVATASATGRDLGRIVGSSAGTSTASGAMLELLRLIGISAGIAGASATLRGFGKLAGSSAGVGVATGTASDLLHSSGASSGAATVSGTLRGIGALSGAVAGAASASGAVLALRRGSGAAAGVSTCSATARALLKGTGSASGLATVSGTLTTQQGLIGHAAGSSTAAGKLSGFSAAAGEADGRATAVATLTGKKQMAGTAAGSAGVSANLFAIHAINGAAAGTSTANGVLRAIGSMHGRAAGVAGNVVSLRGFGALRGLASGDSSASAFLRGFSAIAGLAAGLSDAFATGRLVSHGAGQADGIASGYGTMQGLGRMSGRADGTSRAVLVQSGTSPNIAISDVAVFRVDISDGLITILVSISDAPAYGLAILDERPSLAA